jgi:hypothetical protein
MTSACNLLDNKLGRGCVLLPPSITTIQADLDRKVVPGLAARKAGVCSTPATND